MKKLILLPLAVLLFACGSKEIEKPDPLLSEKQMENILYDISLIQAIKSVNPGVLESNKVDPKGYIYKKYDIDSITFAKNHDYYATHLEQYESMQKRIVERLKQEKEKFPVSSKTKEQNSNRLNAIRKRDSLQRAALNKVSPPDTGNPAQ